MDNAVKIWSAQVRGPFLILAVALVLIGGAGAAADGRFSASPFFLCLAGVVMAHASVNLFNELSDHRTGIDHRTRRTPFSGGSGNLQAGLTTEQQVRSAAWGTLISAAVVGFYLSARAGWLLAAFVVTGGLVTVFYTTVLTRVALGELFAGLCLGSMVVAGTYLAVAGRLTGTILLASVPPGILTFLLLFLNEFPDLEADREGGRRHLLILLGRRRAAVVYVLGLVSCFAVIGAGVAAARLPSSALLTLLVVPLAFKAARITLRHHDEVERMVPALAANVGVVLGVDFLLALGLFLA